MYERAADVAVELLDEALPDPSFVPQPDDGVTYAEKITASDRELDWARPVNETLNRVRALSPHIGARGDVGRHGADGVARAPGRPGLAARRRTASSCSRCSPRADAACRPPSTSAACAREFWHDLGAPSCTHRARLARSSSIGSKREEARGGPVGRGLLSRPPATSPSTSSCACPTRAPTLTARSAQPRPSWRLASTRSRCSSPTARSSACARSTTRSRRSAAGRCASSIRPCSPRSGSAPTSSASWALSPSMPLSNESVELVRRAGSSAQSPSPTRSCVGWRRDWRSCSPAFTNRPPREAALRHSYPDWVAETWWAELGPEEALALMRAQNEPRRALRARQPPQGSRARRAPGRPVTRTSPTRWSSSASPATGSSAGSSGLRAGARSSPAPPWARRPERGRSTSAPRPAARRPSWRVDVVAVELHEGRARELEETAARLGATNVEVVCADAARAARRARRVRPGARRCPVLRPRHAGVPAGPALAGRTAARPSAGIAPRGGRPRPAGRLHHVLRLHDQRRGERGRSWTRSACRPTTSAPSGRGSVTRGDPSSC